MLCELAKDLTNAVHVFILVLNASSSLSMFKAAYSSSDFIHAEKDSHSLFTRNISLDEQFEVFIGKQEFNG